MHNNPSRGQQFAGRNSKVKPRCPFCGLPISRPQELEVHRPGEMPVGSCSCGAVYAYDATGHNLGAAFSEALVFGCNMDWDLAWNLLPEEDYLEALVENYDLESNYIIPAGSFEGRRISGALYFIRLHNDIREATGEAVQRRLDKVRQVVAKPEPVPGAYAKKSFTKKDVEKWVADYQLETIVEVAGRDKRILRDLQRLLYSADELTRHRAASALGRASRVVVEKDPGAVSDLLQKIFTSVAGADYGSSNWGAIDAIGEIIANSPDLFAGYIPTMYQFMNDRELRPRVLRSIARIAEAKPELIQKSLGYFTGFLQVAEPETRGYAAWLTGKLLTSKSAPGTKEAMEALKRITEDNNPVRIYQNGNAHEKTVGQLAAEALGQ
ncbi:DVU0298 family protein [Desulfotruncus alcoholivorax]|uniref:DVU0298 family protein n=1 Tax=Desulfotruncus alcoholivorax TaxID=265477 RepID=UPI0004265753|nr:DVU0298 family protein [Desulfotruncus alcoholivorax]